MARMASSLVRRQVLPQVTREPGNQDGGMPTAVLAVHGALILAQTMPLQAVGLLDTGSEFAYDAAYY